MGKPGSKMDILIIPDGNRRWAKAKGRDFDYGYLQMPVVINRIISFLASKGVNRLYFWCNSINNLAGRPREQVLSFLNHYLDILKHSENPEKIRVHIKGNLDEFAEHGFPEYKSRFIELQKATAANSGFNLYYFLNYTTQDDIERAVRKSFSRNLDKSKIWFHMDEPPNIDVIIRTGGHHRFSGFSPVRSPNAEIFVVDEFFPDISESTLQAAMDKVKGRVVNNGK